MGAPHLHVALAFLEQLLDEFGQKCPQDGWTASIKELCEGPLVQVSRTIVYFKVRATFASKDAAAEEKEAKLTFAFIGGKKDTLGEGLFEVLLRAGAKELSGSAPPNNLEREAQRMLKQLGA